MKNLIIIVACVFGIIFISPLFANDILVLHKWIHTHPLLYISSYAAAVLFFVLAAMIIGEMRSQNRCPVCKKPTP